MSLTELCTELLRQDGPFIDTPWVWSLRWNPTRVHKSGPLTSRIGIVFLRLTAWNSQRLPIRTAKGLCDMDDLANVIGDMRDRAV